MTCPSPSVLVINVFLKRSLSRKHMNIKKVAYLDIQLTPVIPTIKIAFYMKDPIAVTRL